MLLAHRPSKSQTSTNVYCRTYVRLIRSNFCRFPITAQGIGQDDTVAITTPPVPESNFTRVLKIPAGDSISTIEIGINKDERVEQLRYYTKGGLKTAIIGWTGSIAGGTFFVNFGLLSSPTAFNRSKHTGRMNCLLSFRDKVNRFGSKNSFSGEHVIRSSRNAAPIFVLCVRDPKDILSVL